MSELMESVAGTTQHVLLYALESCQLFPIELSESHGIRVGPRKARGCRSSLSFSSALLNAGYSVSRSHASAGSIKTNAPISFVHDVIREFIKTHPVRRDKISDGSPALKMLDKAQTYVVCLCGASCD